MWRNVGNFQLFKQPLGGKGIVNIIRSVGVRFLIVATALLAPVSGFGQQKPSGLKIEPYVFETSDKQKVDAEFGRLTVPENRRAPRSKSIELAFVRFKSTAKNPGAPIIYLAGGPGGSGIAAARGSRFPLFMAMREFGDVIALDQRGTGDSKPALRCREAWRLPPDVPGSPAETSRLALEGSRRCAEQLRSEGIDLDSYNTAESADDIEALRKAIGAKKVSLWGISYGTFLALATIKSHGGNIDRAILAGVEGLDDTHKLPSSTESQFDYITSLIAADSKLSEQVPDLRKLMRAVLERLEKEPVTVEVTDRQTKQQVKVGLSKFDLQLITAQGLGDSQFIASLPAFYLTMSRGDFSSLAERVLTFRKYASYYLSPILSAMDCASGASAARRARIEREEPETLLGDAANFPFPEVCAAWGVPDLGNSFRAPVKSRVPMLLISGTLDGRTPPSNAEAVRRGFSRSTHLVIEGAGHDNDLFLSSPQIKDVMLAFMRGDSVPTIKISLLPFKFRLPDPQARVKTSS